MFRSEKPAAPSASRIQNATKKCGWLRKDQLVEFTVSQLFHPNHNDHNIIVSITTPRVKTSLVLFARYFDESSCILRVS